MPTRVILKDVIPEDFVLATRAARYLMEQFRKDVIVSYGDKNFYVCRNKASITVRPC